MRRQMTHPDSGVLAEYRAGQISGRRGARIAAHLSACDHCAGVSDQLAEISVLLAAAPVPAMPDSVARRLDTVLEAEAAKRIDAERAGAQAPRGRSAHRRRARRGGWRLVTARVLAPAAAVVALAAVGFELSHIGGSTSSSAASAARPPAAHSAPLSAAPSAGKIAAPGNGAQSRAFPADLPPPGFTVIYSGTNYLRATLRHQLEAMLRASASPGLSRPPSTQIEGCVSRLTRGISPGTPLRVERAYYQGQPAIVIVASGRGGDPAWVTGLGCSSAGSDVLDMTVLTPGISAP